MTDKETSKPNLYPKTMLLAVNPDQDIPEEISDIQKEAFIKSMAHGFVVGAKVMRSRGVSHDIGTVLGYNTCTGLYNGDRYPIVVDFNGGTFKYGPESLRLIEVPEDSPLTPYCIHQISEGSKDIRAQDDISGDRDRAYDLPFRKWGQFDHSGPVAVQTGERWYGYLWTFRKEEAIKMAIKIIG